MKTILTILALLPAYGQASTLATTYVGDRKITLLSEDCETIHSALKAYSVSSAGIKYGCWKGQHNKILILWENKDLITYDTIIWKANK